MYRVIESISKPLKAPATGLRVALLSSLACFAAMALAQTQPAPNPAPLAETSSSAPSTPVASMPQASAASVTGKAHASAGVSNLPWTALSAVQREALAPLAETWNAFSDTRKRKWIAIANSLPNLSPEERQKLRERMDDWAKLSRRDREQARLNFAQSKTISKADLAANWEAYQALSTEERQRLAALAPQKLPGAAIAVKPPPVERMVSIPLTRQTPAAERSAFAQQMQLDRNTLLPRQSAARAASAPVKP